MTDRNMIAETLIFATYADEATRGQSNVHRVRPAADGGPSYANLEQLLGNDTFGAIRVIYADGSMVANVRAIVERCWHDAKIVTARDAVAERAA